MTRMASASSSRGQSRPQDKPREGTRVRKLYDRLRTGEAFYVPNDLHATLLYLRDFYGIEYVRMARGWVRMTGEWYGLELVPIEKIMGERYVDD